MITRDLGEAPLPHVADANLAGIRGQPKSGVELATRRLSDELIAGLRAADIPVVGAPMQLRDFHFAAFVVRLRAACS